MDFFIRKRDGYVEEGERERERERSGRGGWKEEVERGRDSFLRLCSLSLQLSLRGVSPLLLAFCLWFYLFAKFVSVLCFICFLRLLS